MAANKPAIIALAGKGGVGKTSLSALFVRILSETYTDKKILAIDADPAIGLSTALGIEIFSTVDDIRKSFISTVEEENTKAAVELLGEAKFQMLDALIEKDNISFLAIGRPETAGCYCKVNAYLKEIISMFSDNYDYVVIDGEAGIEQVNRRVMEKVTDLVLVSDCSKKGIQVIQTIHKVAKDLVMFDRAAAVINRVPENLSFDNPDLNDLPVISLISDDKDMLMTDINGDNIFGLKRESAIYKGAREALKNLEMI